MTGVLEMTRPVSCAMAPRWVAPRPASRVTLAKETGRKRVVKENMEDLFEKRGGDGFRQPHAGILKASCTQAVNARSSTKARRTLTLP